MTVETPLWIQDESVEYSARQDRQILAALFSEGVIDRSGGDLAVTQRAAGANMSVDVAAGRAVIAGDDQADQGSYLVEVTAGENLVVGAAPGSNSRIDLVVLEVRDENAGGATGNDAQLRVVAGTPASSPSVPATPDSAIVLAEILIASTDPSVSTAMITDRRTQARNPHDPAAPVGVMYPYGASTAPTGYLLCDGSAVSRATYAELFEVIGVAYGAGDGSTTFNLPNAKGKTLFGRDPADTDFDTIGETGGAKTTESGIPTGGGTAYTLSGGGVSTGPTILHTHNVGVLPPYLVVSYIIKAR